MYKFVLMFFSVIILSRFALAGDVFQIDIKESKLEWEGRKVTGAHNGTINLKEGSFEFTSGRLKGGNFSIDMTSIINSDLEDAGWNKKLIDHLKSDDFFSVKSFPYAKFQITDVKNYKDSDTDANYLVIGDLTIKGITKPIEFPAIVENKDGLVTAEAKIEVDRSKYDIRYGSGSFFSNLGDKMIYDNFTLNVMLTATK